MKGQWTVVYHLLRSPNLSKEVGGLDVFVSSYDTRSNVKGDLDDFFINLEGGAKCEWSPCGWGDAPCYLFLRGGREEGIDTSCDGS